MAGTRYYEIDKDSSSTFPTRLVSKGGVYSYNNDTLENNALLLQKAGFLEHENCIPYLAKTDGTKASKADAELRKVDVLDVNVLPRVQKGKKELAIRLKEQLVSQVKEIEERRKPLLRKLRQKNKEVSRIKECKRNFLNLYTVPLRDLKQGSYSVKAAKRLETRFGTSFKLLIEDGEGDYTTWSNKDLTNTLVQLEQGDLINKDGGFLSLDKKSLGVLEITEKGTNAHGNVAVYTNFILNAPNKEKKSSPTPKVIPTLVNEIPTIPRENLLPYRDYENITVLPVGSVHNVEAIGNITHYGTPRLVIKIEGKIYQAGQDLEDKEVELKKDCRIKIEKVRLNISRRVKYAICKIYEKGDWTAMTDYKDTKMLSNFDGTTCIVDVQTVDVKGTKRKLLLTNTGDVYKLKKSKLEEGR